jgi:hypothetical protein
MPVVVLTTRIIWVCLGLLPLQLLKRGNPSTIEGVLNKGALLRINSAASELLSTAISIPYCSD